jgi:hypothetical protein
MDLGLPGFPISELLTTCYLFNGDYDDCIKPRITR